MTEFDQESQSDLLDQRPQPLESSTAVRVRTEASSDEAFGLYEQLSGGTKEQDTTKRSTGALPSPHLGTPGSIVKAAQRLLEGQEGGLKRSFAKLGEKDLTDVHSSPRRTHPKPATVQDSPPVTEVAVRLRGDLNGKQELSAIPALDSNVTKDISIAGLCIGPSNNRKRDASSTALEPNLSAAPHKQRLEETCQEAGGSPEESDRLRLMQMQLTDRQSSHAHASSTSPAWSVAQLANGRCKGSQRSFQPPRFQKASSPDIPEPPHKKGSGRRSSSDSVKGTEDAPLRRKLPEVEQLHITQNGSSTSQQQHPGSRAASGADLLPRLSLHLESNSIASDSTARLSAVTLQEGDVGELHGQLAVSEGPTEAAKGLAAELKLAGLLGSRGKTEAALKIANRLWLLHPTNSNVLCLRGNCFAAMDNRAQAFACYTAALNADNSHIETLLACGTLLRNCMLLSEATDMFRRAHEAQPDRSDIQKMLAAALTDLGTKLKMTGKLKEGQALYEESIVISPAYGPAFYNLGVVWSEAGNMEKALESYSKAVEVQPAHAEAHCNMGVIYKNKGQLDEAIAAYERALTHAPKFQMVVSNLAIALTEKALQVKVDGDMEKSIELYERALVHNPRHTEALYNLAAVLGEAGKAQKAAIMYEMAIMVSPSCAEAHNNLGVVHRELGNMEKALQCYMAALHIRPTFPEALNNLAIVLTAQGKAQDAHNMLMAAVAACPTYAEAYNNLGVLQRDVGAVKDAIKSYEKCLELQPDSRTAGQNRLLALNYIYPGELAMVCEEHKQWGMAFEEQFEKLPALRSEDQEADRQLVVGYISPDYFTHSVSYFAEAPLTHHNPEKVKVIAYNCTHTCDAKTNRLKKCIEACCGTWRDVCQLSEQDLATKVREDKVDILVELTGHTANNRLGVMAQRPAPVQGTWIGYPNSTGLESVDYRFTDMVCDPLDTQQTFAEELVHLPGCFLCYTPSQDAPEVSKLPALDLGFVTFGSFNALAKITPEVIRVWCKVLRGVPNSRLLLKNKPSACEHARQHIMSQFEAEGLTSDRVDLLPLTAGNADHLATYSQMDVSLDPWPYAGTTTTCESLYMGVPVISLSGSCHAHNVGASLLTCVGLEAEWLAFTEEEYVSLALKAATNLQQLANLRASLRDRVLASPLCDGPAFVEQLEAIYRRLWVRWLEQGN